MASFLAVIGRQTVRACFPTGWLLMNPSSSSHTRLCQDEVDCAGSDVRAGRRAICARDELFQVRVTLDCRGSQVLTAYSSCSMNSARYFARHFRRTRLWTT